MTADLDFGVEIVGVPTVREADGLAMSSRNRLLSPRDREAVRCVPRALDAAAEPHARLEYGEARDPNTLEEVEASTAPTLLALAVWVGSVRLIDNRVLVRGRANP